MTQVLKDVPATATFVAGMELASDNIGVSYDPLGNQLVSATDPIDFGTIPAFSALRLWTPFDSQCFYVHNKSDQAGLGPPTVLVLDAVSTEAENLGGGVSLVSAEGCDDPLSGQGRTLTQAERTVAPGEVLRARLELDIRRSPGEGPLSFTITVGGTFVPLALGADLRPTAMEVSQGIQNLANDMPLVEDRRTIVRVYVDNSALPTFDTDVSNVRARLYATRGGANISGSPINAMNHPITVKADGGDRRNLDDSFWFYLPSGWRSGTVELRAVIDYNDTINESNESNNEITETVTFNDDIDDEIKELLNDPDSYERDSMYARRALSEARSDGTKYYTRLDVRFRARNAFGGMARGYGLVDLSENAEGHCRITSTTIED